MRYDVAVLGLGGIGSAVLAHVAARVPRAIGLERFALGHENGASAGRTRIVRKAYFEAPAYVPLLERAYALWRALERETNETLLDLVGVLLVGAADATALAGAATSAARFGVSVEALDHATLARRFPMLRALADEVGLFEPEAGIVFPERATAAHLRLARARGATVRAGVGAVRWEATPGGPFRLLSDGGAAVEADRLAICAGPWLGSALNGASLPLRVQRNVQLWFEPASDAFSRGRLPAFLLDRRGAPCALYGFPDLGDGVKAALHGFGEVTDPNALDRTIRTADIAAVRERLNAFLPGAAARYRFGKACMYALTPDEHFALGAHPLHANAVVAGGFSGHGFKFAPVAGEIVADLLLDGGTAHDIGFLSLERFARAGARARIASKDPA